MPIRENGWGAFKILLLLFLNKAIVKLQNVTKHKTRYRMHMRAKSMPADGLLPTEF